MKFYENLKKEIVKCSMLSVPITRHDRYKYSELFDQNPIAFKTNVTKTYYMEMRNYIRDGKVWRNNCSGTVRHGKSEVAQTWTMVYIDEFNEAIKKGCFKYLEKQGIKYKIQTLNKLKAEDILFGQGNYLYELRKLQKEDKMVYGQPRIIDEDEENTGGTGSYSERLEITNMNNITAQALQSEWQLRPDRFVLINASYGLHQEKMDRKNRINWSMLYQLRTHPTRTTNYIFIGWVATPLHKDEKLRKAYNERKKENIIKVLSGEGNLRLNERYKVSKLLAEDELFKMRTTSNKAFKLSKQQQESILNEWIIDGKIQNFNSIEKYEIVEHSRLIIERKLIETVEVEAE